jgi:putative transposase
LVEIDGSQKTVTLTAPGWDFEVLRERMEEFIERYYNVCRLHSALDYRSPEDFEKESQRASQRTSTAAMMRFFEG